MVIFICNYLPKYLTYEAEISQIPFEIFTVYNRLHLAQFSPLSTSYNIQLGNFLSFLNISFVQNTHFKLQYVRIYCRETNLTELFLNVAFVDVVFLHFKLFFLNVRALRHELYCRRYFVGQTVVVIVDFRAELQQPYMFQSVNVERLLLSCFFCQIVSSLFVSIKRCEEKFLWRKRDACRLHVLLLSWEFICSCLTVFIFYASASVFLLLIGFIDLWFNH